ncbi:uncharacterized protein RMCN_0411 [Mycolicibacterium novocastrense]|uniref:Uncharacterized protein n=1 Tax=Mycolicibacterium novocastrense TaxID=59813 RepID=A0ABQ0KCM7_MYCNV|nr:uncharacterized protein RMCN_0411 [Mycolicibacterium novocastrense]
MGGNGFRNAPVGAYGVGAVTVSGVFAMTASAGFAPFSVSVDPSDGPVCCRTMPSSSTADALGVYLLAVTARSAPGEGRNVFG